MATTQFLRTDSEMLIVDIIQLCTTLELQTNMRDVILANIKMDCSLNLTVLVVLTYNSVL